MYRRRQWLIWSALLLLAIASYLDNAGVFGYQGPDRNRYESAEPMVTYAADGDTIDVDVPDGRQTHTRIRLWGIDCPEIAHRQGEKDAYFGPEATQYVRAQVVGRRVRLAFDPNRRPRDRYGRLLAYAYFADTGEMVNETLIREGLAYADRRFEHVLKHDFVEREKRAMRSKTGLWASVTPDQMPEWRQRMDAAKAR